MLRTLLPDVNITCFADIYNEIKKIRNAEKFNPKCSCSLQLVNCYPATFCTAGGLFSTTRRSKTWMRSTMKNRRFSILSLLNVHKELTGKLDLVFWYFGNFV